MHQQKGDLTSKRGKSFFFCLLKVITFLTAYQRSSRADINVNKALRMSCLAGKEIFDLKKHLLQKTVVVQPQPASKYHAAACSRPFPQLFPVKQGGEEEKKFAF